MKVKDLILRLQAVDPNLDIVVDHDENGYYTLQDAQIKEDKEEGETYLNLVSSNEV